MKSNLKRSVIDLSLIVAILAFIIIPYICQLGFYHDDWQFVFARSAGQDIKFYFTVDRPFMGTILAKSAIYLGYNAFLWQLFSFLVRLAGGFVFYLLLEAIFPKLQNKWPILFATMLFLVYPGFLIQPSAVTHIPHLLALLFALLSFFLVILTLKIKSSGYQDWLLVIILTILAGLLTYAYLAILEYFIGMVGVLIVLLIVAIPNWGDKRDRIKNVKLVLSRAFFPLIAAIVFLYWRFWIFVPKRAAVQNELIFNSFSNQPFAHLGQLLKDLVTSTFQTLISAYFIPFFNLFSGLEPFQIILHILIAAVFLGLLIWTLRKNKPQDSQGWQISWIVTGLLLVVIPLVPIILVGRPVSLTSDFNRYTLQSIPGVALVLVGLAFLLKNPIREILLSALLAISIITLLNNQAHFVQKWNTQREAWQQVVERIPGLKEGTVLVLHLPRESRFAEGFEISAAANLIYSGGVFPDQPQMPAVIGEILNDITLPAIQAQSSVDRYTKTVPLHVDYSKLLVLSQPTAASCLHLIGNPAYLSAEEPEEVRAAAAFSHPGQVLLSGSRASLPAQLFGTLPDDDWCAIYQQADLAAQQEDWAKVSSLAEEARLRGLSPVDASEWLPFYRAFVELGNHEAASRIAEKMAADAAFIENLCSSPGAEAGLCAELQK